MAQNYGTVQLNFEDKCSIKLCMVFVWNSVMIFF